MKPYVPTPGRPPAKAIAYLVQINREATAAELAPIMGTQKRQVSGMMKNAHECGAVHIRIGSSPEARRLAFYSIMSPEKLAEAMERAKAESEAERARIASDAKSVRRPNVARDVWQYAQEFA